MATKGTKGKKRDSYQSQLYPDTAVPVGVGAASMDLACALSAILQWIEREEWQSQRIQIDQTHTMDLIEVIQIAIAAWKQTINPAVIIYDRLQQNAQQAEQMFLAAALAESKEETERWGIVGGVLKNTLQDKAMAPRYTLALARKLIKQADADDNTAASTLIHAIVQEAEEQAAALEQQREENHGSR